MKNLVLCHLEGMSHSIFWQYHDELPELHALKNKSMYFSNFHAAGTSTLFMYYALQHGSISLLDGVSTYSRGIDIYPLREGFGELLRNEHGYDCIGAYCITSQKSHVGLRLYNKIFGIDDPIDLGQIRPESDFAPLVERLRQQKTRRRPFFLMFAEGHDFWHVFPHHFAIGDDLCEKFRSEYKDADTAVKLLLQALEQTGNLEDTMIVFFGDHGISAFNKWFNDIGITSGIYADATASRTILMMYNSPLGSGTRTDLCSSIDIKPTILNLLFPDRHPPKADSDELVEGIDLTKQKRRYAMAQNSFALQPKDEDVARRSYALIDRNYRFIVSEVRPGDRNGGMEMCIDSVDPANNSNLLHLFVLDDQGDVIDYNLEKIATISRRNQFYGTFNPDILASLTRRYYEMRTKLMECIRSKEEAALKLPNAKPFFFSQDSFNKVAGIAGSGGSSCKGLRYLKSLNKPVVIFGAGIFASEIASLLDFHNIEISCFIDSAKEKQEGKVGAWKVLSPENVLPSLGRKAIVVSSVWESAAPEIKAQCQSFGLDYCNYAEDLFNFRITESPPFR